MRAIMVAPGLALGILVLAFPGQRRDDAGDHGRRDPELPAPTGPHAVGRTSFHWVDHARGELDTADPDDVRELMVHLFYPAEIGSDAPRAVYVPDADPMLGPFTAQHGRLDIERGAAVVGHPAGARPPARRGSSTSVSAARSTSTATRASTCSSRWATTPTWAVSPSSGSWADADATH
jgi:hypothetical protein